MANDRKLKSLSELRSLMTAENKDPEKSVVLGTAENAESLYQQAKQKLAKGDTSEGVRSLEAVKHVPSLSDEFKQIVQERITASERKGIDKETESLRSAIRQRGSGSASILDLFRLHHRLDRPQRVLQTTGIQGGRRLASIVGLATINRINFGRLSFAPRKRETWNLSGYLDWRSLSTGDSTPRVSLGTKW